jgi:hypothetical protein
MGTAISPRGDMPKYRVPLFARRFCMSTPFASPIASKGAHAAETALCAK